ncbi:hypothetical protein RUM44_013398 [Polyplax serrata]|uniref:Lysosomal acid phosphatase n=1 Tax=Polyplax serrata TaxID=468196 RepID=A0ABR1BE25_POLSC
MPQLTQFLYLNRKGILLGLLGAVLLLGIGSVPFFAFGERSHAPERLVLVSILVRHGDRTPTSFYPNDPHRNSTLWVNGLGALTKVGKQKMYEIGRLFRNRYNDFLSEKYSPNDVYVFSSDSDRCLMSAQLFLAGLFPPVGEQIWNRHIAWQPIPVHTIPRHLDKLIIVAKPCPKYSKALNETYSNEFFVRLNTENADLYKYLEKHSGKPMNYVMDVEDLFNTLEVEKLLYLKLPEWAEKNYDKMKELALLGLASLTFTDTTKRLKAGPLLSEVVEHMSKKVLGLMKQDRKLYLYSGHDVNIVSLLRTLGHEEVEKPEYGASIIFELYRPALNEGDHSVKLLYLNNSQSSPLPLRIPGCNEPCTLKDFLRITKPMIPVNWEAECLL